MLDPGHEIVSDRDSPITRRRPLFVARETTASQRRTQPATSRAPVTCKRETSSKVNLQQSASQLPCYCHHIYTGGSPLLHLPPPFYPFFPKFSILRVRAPCLITFLCSNIVPPVFGCYCCGIPQPSTTVPAIEPSIRTLETFLNPRGISYFSRNPTD